MVRDWMSKKARRKKKTIARDPFKNYSNEF